MNYNLLEEEWIPVLFSNGMVKRVNVIKAFTEANRIRGIAATNPMDRLAILRFLLALLYWCKRSSPGGLPERSFPLDWLNELQRHRDCFNLLGDGRRFYQSRQRDSKKTLPANYLVQEVPTGTNLWHFRHSTDESDGLCLSCCAMGLLRLPLFATSGGRGKPPGVNAKPPVYVVPLGTCLADTLRLSWREVSDLGTPSWEKPDLVLPRTGKVPLLVGLTWLPRRVWLDDPEESEARCISCGREERLIRRTVFAGVGSMKSDADGGPRDWKDPHVVSEGNDIVRPSDALDRSDAAAGQWARVMAGILNEPRGSVVPGLWVVGFATVQNDKYLEAMESMIPFSLAPEDRKCQESVNNIRMWQKEGQRLRSKLANIIRPRAPSRKYVQVEARAMVDGIRPHVESHISARVGKLITGGEGWEQAAREYSPMMTAVAKTLSPGYTTTAFHKRQKIASLRPDMWPKTLTNEGSSQKTGGGN